MFKNKTQQFSRFYLNDNKSKLNEYKNPEFVVEEVKISILTKK